MFNISLETREENMNYQRLFSIAALTIITTLLLLQNGCCTMAGTVIGSMRDDRKPKQKPRQGWELTEIEPGTKIWATLNDSSLVAGKFAAVTPVNHDRLVSLYMHFQNRDSETALLPAIGDSLSILPKKGYWLRGRLKDVSCLDSNFKWGFSFAIEQLDSGSLRNYPLDKITALRRGDGEVLSGPRLVTLMLDSEGILPFSAIRIATDSGQQTVAIENIANLTIPNRRHGMLTGLLIGAALDAVWISIGLAFQESMQGMGR